MKTDNHQLKYFVYCRKSTEDEDRQVLSLDSQIAELMEMAARDGLKIIGTPFRESKSAKAPDKRPVFNEMLLRIKRGEAHGILCWKLDRLARNPDEAGKIIGMLQREEIQHIKTREKDYRPEDNSLLSYVEFGIANQYIRDLSVNVKRGLRAKLQMGWYPSHAPLGYLNSERSEEKGRNWIYNDPERFESVKRMWQMMLTGNYTPPQILKIAKSEWNFKTRDTKRYTSKHLSRSMIYKIFSNPFYSGYFEYPKGCGEWTRGKHEAMVSREEFDRVQILLGNKARPRPLTRRFAFTGIMKCGNCGAAITAEEKIKRQKNGNVHQYIYYRCTKRKDESCPEKTIELSELTKQADAIIRGLTISDRFKDWAIKYLYEVRQNEAQSSEQTLANKQSRLLEITKQLDNMFLRLTSPSNANGELISEAEYKNIKGTLLKEKNALESELQAQGKAMEQWLELSERTFNFARYASTWFAKGDMETKRAIFACLGSDFILKDQKLNIQLRKPFKFIFDNLPELEKEMIQVRTSENASMKGQIVSFVPQSLLMRR